MSGAAAGYLPARTCHGESAISPPSRSIWEAAVILPESCSAHGGSGERTVSAVAYAVRRIPDDPQPACLGRRQHCSEARAHQRRSRLVAPVEDLLEKARRLDLSSAESRFRLGELTEALRLALPAVVDLHERLALDLELDRDTITEAWFMASAFRPATRRPGLPWTTYVLLRFHPARYELADQAAREG
jgi:hypothetical protein